MARGTKRYRADQGTVRRLQHALRANLQRLNDLREFTRKAPGIITDLRRRASRLEKRLAEVPGEITRVESSVDFQRGEITRETQGERLTKRARRSEQRLRGLQADLRKVVREQQDEGRGNGSTADESQRGQANNSPGES